MKKQILCLVMVLTVLLVLPASVPASVANAAVKSAKINTSASTPNKVLAARFENMLNHNYLYGSDFESDRFMIEDSILALLDQSENGQISQDLVLGFIAGMYGRQVNPAAAVYDFLPADEGMFAILPRGYDAYSHTVTSIEEIDGGYKVISSVVVSPCGGFDYTTTCESLFVLNQGSAFGYNLIAAELMELPMGNTL